MPMHGEPRAPSRRSNRPTSCRSCSCSRADPLLQSFAAGGLILFVFGLWDDAKQVSHWIKFVGQIVAAGLVVYHGDLYVARLPFFDSMVLDPSIGKPFTIFALVGVINAINHSDGLDGLASGESMLSLIAIAFLGYLCGNALVIGMALATIGGTLGFLRYNTHPARCSWATPGSQFLGFTLGVLLVYLTQVALHHDERRSAAAAARPADRRHHRRALSAHQRRHALVQGDAQSCSPPAAEPGLQPLPDGGDHLLDPGGAGRGRRC